MVNLTSRTGTWKLAYGLQQGQACGLPSGRLAQIGRKTERLTYSKHTGLILHYTTTTLQAAVGTVDREALLMCLVQRPVGTPTQLIGSLVLSPGTTMVNRFGSTQQISPQALCTSLSISALPLRQVQFQRRCGLIMYECGSAERCTTNNVDQVDDVNGAGDANALPAKVHRVRVEQDNR